MQSMVSVIIPCYNYAHFLEESADSVIDQTYTNWECLIIDDGSTDDTKSVAEELMEKDSRVKYYYQQNKGLSAARNKGFAMAKGNYIQFLDADDMIHPQKLKEQVEVLDNDPSIGVSYTNYQTFTDDLLNLTGRYSHLQLGDKPLEDFLFKWERGLSIPIHAALFRKSVFEKIGKPFVEELRAKEDWVMWINLALSGIKIYKLDKDYCFYRQHKFAQTKEIYVMCSNFIRAMFIILKMLPTEYNDVFFGKSLNHIETVYLNIVMNPLLFFDRGKGFNASDFLTHYQIAQEYTSFIVKYSLLNVGNIDQLRFDPFEGYWIKAKLNEVKYTTIEGDVKELDLDIVTSNGVLFKNGFTVFHTFDPMFFLPVSGEFKQIEISGDLSILDNEKIEEAIQEKEKKVQELNLIYNSTSWKITAPLRVFRSYVKALNRPKKIFNNKIEEGETKTIIKKDRDSRLSMIMLFLKLVINRPCLSLRLIHPRRIKNAIKYLKKDKGNLRQLAKRYQEIYVDGSSGEVNEKNREFTISAKLNPNIGTIFIFPLIDWSFRHQRPQHFALNLGKLGYRVIYFSTTPLINKKLPFMFIDNPGKNVYLCKLINTTGKIDDIQLSPMADQTRNAYQKSILSLMQQLEINESVSLLNHYYWNPLADIIPNSIIGYDCMDFHVGFYKNNKDFPEREIELIKKADFVVTTSTYLSEKISKYRPNTIIRNGCECALFLSDGDCVPRDERPVAGYVGAIAEWFDINLIIFAAKQLPEWSFILVGSTVGCNTELANNLNNIEFIGEVDYFEVPSYLRSFDVCLIPFLINELTKATNPVKIYEYLCIGKPVVSTALPETAMLRDKVLIGNTYQEFVDQLKIALLIKDDPDLLAERKKWALAQDWSFRVKELERIILQI